MTTLAELHDCLLLDLDGTVFRGQQPTEGSVETLASVEPRTLFVTNNASRGSDDVAKNLVAMGFDAKADDVVTSAQSAARLLATQMGSGSKVLVIGTEALADEVRKVGLEPVRKFADKPDAVVQGHSPETGWADLAEAALAIRDGALWVAANVDRTLPSEVGLLPGNGSMVAALETATDQRPQVAGKPQPPLLLDALARGEFERPLVIGDRLDTDISGANAAGLPSMLVLTGVSSVSDMIYADAAERPNYLAADLRSLNADSGTLRVAPHPSWRVEVGPQDVTVYWTGREAEDPLSIVRAVASTVWGSSVDGVRFSHPRRGPHGTRSTGTLVVGRFVRSASVKVEMTTDPDQIRAMVAALLADLPDPSADDAEHVDVERIAASLEEAHDLLVRALESVER